MAKINNPAWAGIRPGPVRYRNNVAPRLSAWIMDMVRSGYVTGLEGRYTVKAMGPVKSGRPFGHYHIKTMTAGGTKEFYARISRPFSSRENMLSHRISAYLSGKGCGVGRWMDRAGCASPAVIERSAFDEPVQFTLSLFKKVSVLPASPADLARAGRAVGKLHKALRNAPFSREIAAACVKRVALLNSAKKDAARKYFRICGGKMPPGYREFMARMDKSYIPDFIISPGLDRQVIHGDLNAGNILKEGERSILIVDFEDTTHSYFPRLVDMAFFAERCIFFDMPAAQVLARRLSAFFRGYLAAEESPFSPGPVTPSGQLLGMMKQINYYAFCALACAAEEDAGYPVNQELRKFVLLEKRAQDLMPLSEKLDAAIPGKRNA